MRNCNQHYYYFHGKNVLSQKKGLQNSFSAFPSKLFFKKNWSQNHIYTLEFLKMWYGKTRVTSYELKALKHDLKFKSASSNLRATSSNPRVTSSHPWVASSNLRVTSSNPRIIKLMKTQVNSLKISSFPKIIISAACICLVFFLTFSVIKQSYSKVGNSRMYRYGNAIAALTFC